MQSRENLQHQDSAHNDSQETTIPKPVITTKSITSDSINRRRRTFPNEKRSSAHTLMVRLGILTTLSIQVRKILNSLNTFSIPWPKCNQTKQKQEG